VPDGCRVGVGDQGPRDTLETSPVAVVGGGLDLPNLEKYLGLGTVGSRSKAGPAAGPAHPAGFAGGCLLRRSEGQRTRRGRSLGGDGGRHGPWRYTTYPDGFPRRGLDRTRHEKPGQGRGAVLCKTKKTGPRAPRSSRSNGEPAPRRPELSGQSCKRSRRLGISGIRGARGGGGRSSSTEALRNTRFVARKRDHWNG